MANLTWSEPQPPATEKTERAFAPLIDPVQKNELIETRRDLARHRDTPADDAQPQAQAAQTNKPDTHAGQAAADVSAADDTSGETLADAPAPRPTLDK
jgi:hypothetical protein